MMVGAAGGALMRTGGRTRLACSQARYRERSSCPSRSQPSSLLCEPLGLGNQSYRSAHNTLYPLLRAYVQECGCTPLELLVVGGCGRPLGVGRTQ